MALDLSPLVKTVARLDEGLARFRTDEADSQIRDGLIQRFEFTYDLSHRMLRSALEAAAANPEEVDRMSFPSLICTAFEQGLVASDWTAWRTWRELRRMASHTYDEANARQVVDAIPGFLAETHEVTRRLAATGTM